MPIDTKRFQSYRVKTEIILALKVSAEEKISSILDSLFQINLLLAYIDEFLESNQGFIYELSSICEFLYNATLIESHRDIKVLLLDKAAYLGLKIKSRNSLVQENATKAEGPIFSEEIESEYITNAYSKFVTNTLHHYKSFDYLELEALRTAIQNVILEPNIRNVYLAPFHHLNRFIAMVSKKQDVTVEKIMQYKDEIDRCIDIIEERSERIKKEVLPLITKVAFESIKNLLKNTSLKFKFTLFTHDDFSVIINSYKNYILKGENYSDFISVYYQEAVDIGGKKDSMQDFNSLMIFLEFLSTFIEYMKNNSHELVFFDDVILDKIIKEERRKRVWKIVEDIKNVYKESLNKLNFIFDLLRTHRVRPVYLTMNDCTTSFEWTDGYNGLLFLYSSYTLPNNPSKLKNKIDSFDNSYHAKVSSLKNTLEIAYAQHEIDNKSIEFDNKATKIESNLDVKVQENEASMEAKVRENEKALTITVDNTKNDLTQKLKENEFKLVQIIAMFVSIATFVLINVKIFDGKSGLESFAIIIGLAACFFIFNLFFHFIVVSQYEGDNKANAAIKRVKKLIYVPIVFVAISGGILIFQEKGITTGQIQVINASLDRDSLKLKKDSTQFVEIGRLRADLRQDSIQEALLEARIRKLEHR